VSYSQPVKPPAPLEPKQERSHATRQRLLDAAVDELLESGYASLTTTAVAARAGVSRGAQQNHFPHKVTLVVEAVRHLWQRQIEELQQRLERVPVGRDGGEHLLDSLFALFRGPLFAAIVEVSLAARTEPLLHEVVSEEKRTVREAMRASATGLLDPSIVADENFEHSWAITLSTVRGLALLTLLDDPQESIERQWRFTRPALLRLLRNEPPPVELT
jgi:AcrR family transcriptional regulator